MIDDSSEIQRLLFHIIHPTAPSNVADSSGNMYKKTIAIETIGEGLF